MKYRVWRLESVAYDEGYVVNDRHELAPLEINLRDDDEKIIKDLCIHTGIYNDDDLRLESFDDYGFYLTTESISLLHMEAE